MTTLALVRKLLRDLRWPLLVVMLLLAGFQCLWVKITQRTVAEISPVFSTLAARAGTSQKAIEEVIFSGPGKLAQTIIGGESLHFERAMDVLSVGYVHPLMQLLFCLWAIGRAAGCWPVRSTAGRWNCCSPSRSGGGTCYSHICASMPRLSRCCA